MLGFSTIEVRSSMTNGFASELEKARRAAAIRNSGNQRATPLRAPRPAADRACRAAELRPPRAADAAACAADPPLALAASTAAALPEDAFFFRALSARLSRV